MASVDVNDIMDEQKTGVFHVRIVLLCALMLFLDGIDNQGISYVAPALTKAWHLSRGALAPVFTAGIIGVALGALVTGPLTDRFGRRPMMLGTVIWFSVLTLAVTQASNLSELLMLRFLAGLGLGSLVPMAVVVSSESAPLRTRATMVTLATCGYSIGAASGGLLAAQLVPLYGWPSIFWVGGIAPLFLVLAMWAWLPESVRLLALRPGTGPRIAGILRTVNPALEFPADTQFVNTREPPKREFRPFQLFTEGRTSTTLLLWVIFFLNLTVLNLLNSWLPTLVDTTGLPHEQALRIASSFQFGGMVGVISMGVLSDRVPGGRHLRGPGRIGRDIDLSDGGHDRRRRLLQYRLPAHQRGAGGLALSDRYSRHRSELGARHRAHLLDCRPTPGRLPARSRLAAAIHLSHLRGAALAGQRLRHDPGRYSAATNVGHRRHRRQGRCCRLRPRSAWAVGEAGPCWSVIEFRARDTK